MLFVGGGGRLVGLDYGGAISMAILRKGRQAMGPAAAVTGYLGHRTNKVNCVPPAALIPPMCLLL